MWNFVKDVPFTREKNALVPFPFQGVTPTSKRMQPIGVRTVHWLIEVTRLILSVCQDSPAFDISSLFFGE